jgi:Domain of unknown function (DUF1737)
MNSKYSNPDFSYALLRNDDPFKLEIQVIEFMEQGWEPTGGIGIDNRYYPSTLYQAMVRK